MVKSLVGRAQNCYEINCIVVKSLAGRARNCYEIRLEEMNEVCLLKIEWKLRSNLFGAMFCEEYDRRDMNMNMVVGGQID